MDLESQGGNIIYDVLEVIEGKVALEACLYPSKPQYHKE